jgi:1,4-alpha-glucan branching enzyme
MRRAVLLVLSVVAGAAGACGSDAIQASNAYDGGDGRPDVGVPPDASADASASADAGADAGADASDAAPGLGATVGPNGVTFQVWAPNATSASVGGDFTTAPLAMTPGPGSVFEATSAAAHAGSKYVFTLDTPDGTLTRIDPYCRELDGSSCLVKDPSTYAWTTPSFTRPARTQAVVYELHVGSFSVPSGAAYGTFASVASALPQLADLGVNVVELMPVQDFGSGAEGWGYDPQLYLAPKASYGSSDDLRALVDAAHGLGIAVWMDTVVNHTDGYSKAPLICFDGNCPDGGDGIYFFPAGMYAMTPWGPRPNYPDPHVLSMILASASTWMNEFHGDGFRWDSVSNIRAVMAMGTVPGGQALLTQVNDQIHAGGGFSVAEDLQGYAAITQPTSSGGFGFDAQWDGFGYTIDAQLALPSDASRDLGQVVGALTSNYDGDAYARLLFTEDHDTVGNGGSRLPNQIDAADPTSYAARKLSIAGAVMLLTAPGVPMLFMGQESLALGTFLDPPDALAPATAQGLQIRAFYKDMIRLRLNLDGGAGGLGDANIEVFQQNDAAKVVAYRRYGASGEDVIVVVNLMNKAYTEYDVGISDAGPWRIRLNTDSTAYSSDFAAGETGSVTAVAGEKDGKPYTLPLELGAYSCMVITR